MFRDGEQAMTSAYLNRHLRSEAEVKAEAEDAEMKPDAEELNYESITHAAERLSDKRLKDLYDWIVDQFADREAAETERRFAGVSGGFE